MDYINKASSVLSTAVKVVKNEDGPNLAIRGIVTFALHKFCARHVTRAHMICQGEQLRGWCFLSYA